MRQISLSWKTRIYQVWTEIVQAKQNLSQNTVTNFLLKEYFYKNGRFVFQVDFMHSWNHCTYPLHTDCACQMNRWHFDSLLIFFYQPRWSSAKFEDLKKAFVVCWKKSECRKWCLLQFFLYSSCSIPTRRRTVSLLIIKLQKRWWFFFLYWYVFDRCVVIINNMLFD